MALEEVSPGETAMLAAPQTVADLLGPVRLPRTTDEESAADPDTWMHAFLLELGVWETLPVEGFDDAGMIGRPRFPWEEDPFHPLREELMRPDGRWAFGLEGWGGDRHTNVWVAQDFRFRWSLRECANRNAAAGVAAARDGVHAVRAVAPTHRLLSQCSVRGGRHERA